MRAGVELILISWFPVIIKSFSEITIVEFFVNYTGIFLTTPVMINIHEAILANPEYFKTLRVKDSLLINYNCPQIETWAQLFTNLNHIIYTLNGERRIVMPGISMDVKRGSLIFIRKGAFQQGKFHEEDWQVVVFAVHDSYLNSFIREFRHLLQPKPPVADSKKEALFAISTNEITEAYFYGLLPYFIQQPPPHESVLELKLRELLSSIFFDQANARLLSYIDNLVNDSKSAFIEVMESNYMFNLLLTDFAKLTGHSLTTYKTKFKELFNTTPEKWIIQKRLELACRLLQALEKPVNEIAFDCGFESVTHFNRIFKLRFDKTPSEYRRHINVRN
jgi:AraC family transcriptional regulator, exoenzyme S synthesis regulatory protein ExsA